MNLSCLLLRTFVPCLMIFVCSFLLLGQNKIVLFENLVNMVYFSEKFVLTGLPTRGHIIKKFKSNIINWLDGLADLPKKTVLLPLRKKDALQALLLVALQY